MSRRWIPYATLLGAAVVQSLLPTSLFFGGARWPLLTALTIYWALRLPRGRAMETALAAAVLHDALEPGGFGPALLVFPLLAWAANRCRGIVMAESLVAQLVFGGLGALAATLGAISLHWITGRRPLEVAPGFLRLLGSLPAGATALAAVSFFLRDRAARRREGRAW